MKSITCWLRLHNWKYYPNQTACADCHKALDNDRESYVKRKRYIPFGETNRFFYVFISVDRIGRKEWTRRIKIWIWIRLLNKANFYYTFKHEYTPATEEIYEKPEWLK